MIKADVSAPIQVPSSVQWQNTDKNWCIKKREEGVEELLIHLNGIEESIQFTCEMESNGCLPFLDVLMSRQLDGWIRGLAWLGRLRIHVWSAANDLLWELMPKCDQFLSTLRWRHMCGPLVDRLSWVYQLGKQKPDMLKLKRSCWPSCLCTSILNPTSTGGTSYTLKQTISRWSRSYKNH